MPFRERGVPSIQFIEDKTNDFNPHYHKSSDTTDHMVASYFHEMSRYVVAAVLDLAGLQAGWLPSATPPDEPTATLTVTAGASPTATELTPTSETPGTPPTPWTGTPGATPDLTATQDAWATRTAAAATPDATGGTPEPTFVPGTRLWLPRNTRGAP